MSSGNIVNIWKDRSSFLGFFPATGWHSHGAPVLLIGVSGTFELEFRNGEKVCCRSAIVDSGVEHKVVATDELMALFYVNSRSLEALCIRNHYLAGSGYIADVANQKLTEHTFNSVIHDFDLSNLLIDALPPVDSSIDRRIEQSLKWLHIDDRSLPLDQVAERSDLSCSYYSHLFTQNMGVSFRKYRQWSQLSQFYEHYKQVGNFTDAALLSGFSDSSHLSNTFRKIFGVPPSKIIRSNTTLNICR